jgi:hypothetical protein
MHLLRRAHRRAPEPDLDRELAGLTRAHEGVVQQRRMEHLADSLRSCTSGLAVQQTWLGFAADRMTLHLDNGQVLKLSLLWPRRNVIASLMSVRWSSHVGWVLQARDSAGDVVSLYAWRVQLLPR